MLHVPYGNQLAGHKGKFEDKKLNFKVQRCGFDLWLTTSLHHRAQYRDIKKGPFSPGSTQCWLLRAEVAMASWPIPYRGSWSAYSQPLYFHSNICLWSQCWSYHLRAQTWLMVCSCPSEVVQDWSKTRLRAPRSSRALGLHEHPKLSWALCSQEPVTAKKGGSAWDLGDQEMKPAVTQSFREESKFIARTWNTGQVGGD